MAKNDYEMPEAPTSAGEEEDDPFLLDYSFDKDDGTLPVGRYLVRCEKFEKKRKENGAVVVSMVHKVVEGEQKGQTIFDEVTQINKDGAVVKTGFIISNRLDSLKVPVKIVDGKEKYDMKTDGSPAVGKAMVIELEHRDFEGRKFNQIKKTYPATPEQQEIAANYV